ncbi:hypothetical protein [Agriterribacter humi]|jgi:hypothetical protein|uniref:hypothetical protein n=1 Tax=Agriterribacter humi TaxID=1104781 RepID=UPI001264D648|nr:hypothetical protein [Agriterribacter humi]
MEYANSNNPLGHTANLKSKLSELIEHLRKDILMVDDIAAKSLFEVSAEVLVGLHKAFTHYEEGKEDAWKK